VNTSLCKGKISPQVRERRGRRERGRERERERETKIESRQHRVIGEKAIRLEIQIFSISHTFIFSLFIYLEQAILKEQLDWIRLLQKGL
jgi:hypothetical protein